VAVAESHKSKRCRRTVAPGRNHARDLPLRWDVVIGLSTKKVQRGAIEWMDDMSYKADAPDLHTVLEAVSASVVHLSQRDINVATSKDLEHYLREQAFPFVRAFTNSPMSDTRRFLHVYQQPHYA